MNFLKKAYCRVFQFAFHAVLPVLPYREPTIFHSICQLPQLLTSQQIHSVLLVTDPGLRNAGSTTPLETHFPAKGSTAGWYFRRFADRGR